MPVVCGRAADEGVVTPQPRFFGAAIDSGRLRVRGIPDRGPWDPTLLEWASETEIDATPAAAAGDRKIRTREDLEIVMREPGGPASTWFLWIHESLVEDARRVWEQRATAEPR